MHALVTGGAGFIGSSLVDRLLAEGWLVTVIDNFDPYYDPEIKEANIKEHINNPDYRLYRLDICNYHELLQKAGLTAYDVIIHLAARAGVRPSIEDPLTYQQVNVQGTQNLLELAKETGCKQFVFASSSSVYGVNPNVPWKETDHVLLPISPYASTKVSGELLGHVYSHLYGIRFIGLRFFTVYGPRQRPDLAISKFAKLMLAGEAIPFYGNGDTYRDYTFISDIIDGIIAAINYRATNFEVINLGNNQTISLQEMVTALEAELKIKAKLSYLPPQLGDVPKTWADLNKAARLLNYHPKIKFDEGIKRYVDWLKKNRIGG
ncbi:MAG TPA: GDP-mannose 4,6-dehydratase [Bacillota bacterium]|jgi:UDP-glucuronate 4-epimerase|nr:GDP-mannose 4,6-dehydratase [Bacillota bacterium]HOL10995.1 GDP-mannose 4,6-dehydratase [Bacillota bacterium]HPO98873.1 GDP-mannose 4,6-dehydratase [Bacillota bacterium]